jgi:hypothetical protein
LSALLGDVPSDLRPIFDVPVDGWSVPLYLDAYVQNPEAYRGYMQRIAAAWRFAADRPMTQQQVADRVRELAAFPHWGQQELEEMALLVLDGPQDLRPSGPTSIVGMTLNRLVSDVNVVDPERHAAIVRFHEAWKIATEPGMNKARATDRALQLSGRIGNADWTVADSRTLQALLYDIPLNARVDSPEEIGGTPGYYLIQRLLDGDEQGPSLVRRLAANIRYIHDASASSNESTRRVVPILERDAVDWSHQDRADLAMYLFEVPESIRAAYPGGGDRYALKFALDASQRPDEIDVLNVEAAQYLVGRDSSLTAAEASKRVDTLMQRPVARLTSRERAELYALCKVYPLDRRGQGRVAHVVV